MDNFTLAITLILFIIGVSLGIKSRYNHKKRVRNELLVNSIICITISIAIGALNILNKFSIKVI